MQLSCTSTCGDETSAPDLDSLPSLPICCRVNGEEQKLTFISKCVLSHTHDSNNHSTNPPAFPMHKLQSVPMMALMYKEVQSPDGVHCCPETLQKSVMVEFSMPLSFFACDVNKSHSLQVFSGQHFLYRSLSRSCSSCTKAWSWYMVASVRVKLLDCSVSALKTCRRGVWLRGKALGSPA